MSFIMLSGTCSSQVVISNDEAREIISRLEKLDSLEGAVSNIVNELKKKEETEKRMITSGYVAEWSYKTLEANYTRLKNAYNRLRNKNFFWRDFGNGLIGAGIATLIFFIAK